MTLSAIDKALRENACSGKTKAALEGFEPRPFPFCKFIKIKNVNTIRNSVFSVCLFDHLLCLHIVFEQNFVFPVFLTST